MTIMSKSLALLSGKGGSGKTSLALSIASLLAKCDIKVLIVDCDLSTNGATYFYEDRINGKSSTQYSLFEFFHQANSKADLSFNMNDNDWDDWIDYENKKGINDYLYCINVERNIDFVPSIVSLSSRNLNSYVYCDKHYEMMKLLDNAWRKKYDLIIYDCEAGYSDILKTILPFVDIDLFVMEADAISSAALRSLYLKIGDLLHDKKIYQVFNKASKEEYDIYSKISNETFFTNIETVMFDWKIRRAFAIAQIPDMELTSAYYGQQLYNICSTIFKDKTIAEGLNKYKNIIQLNSLNEQEKLLREQINTLNSTKHSQKYRAINIAFTIAITTMTAALVSYLIGPKEFNITDDTTIIVMWAVPILATIIAIFAIFLKKPQYKEFEDKQKALHELERKRIALEKVIEETNNREEIHAATENIEI